MEYMRPQSMYGFLANLPLAQIAIMCIIVSLILERQKLSNSNFQNYFIMGYLFCFLISYLVAFKPELAWQPLVDFVKWVVIYFLLINVINDRRKLYIFVIVFLIINFRYAQFAVRIWAGNNFYSDPRGLHEGAGVGAGFFRNPNDFGVALNVALGISFFMVLYDKRKIFGYFRMWWFHLISTVTFPLAILSTSSRGAALALGIISIGFWVKSRKRVIGLAILCVVGGFLISIIPEDNWARFRMMGKEGDNSSVERIELWRSGLRIGNEYPFFGVGPSNFVYANQYLYKSGSKVVQHNVFIQAVSELGYPGLIFFVMMIVG